MPATANPTASRRRRRWSVLAALGAWAAAAAVVGAEQTLAVASEPEGLVRQASRALDEYYLRPGARLSGYQKILLAPVEVSFAPYWAGEHREIDPGESLRIRQALARLAQAEFRQMLQRKNGYPVVEAAGAGVLELRASLVNLDLHAPEARDSAIRRNYVLSAGEATLVAELRDSQTGTLLARIVDRREMRRYAQLQLADTISNSAEVRDLVSNWARLLRRQLDSAKSDDKGS
jgi:Protein of unknown function (DUF3313)